MEYSIVEKHNNYYHVKEETSYDICVIRGFLTDDAMCYSPMYRNWVFDDTLWGSGGNMTDLEKEGDFILIEPLYVGEHIIKRQVRVHRDEFVKLLDAWGKVCKTKPNKIKITMYDGTFDIQVLEE